MTEATPPTVNPDGQSLHTESSTKEGRDIALSNGTNSLNVLHPANTKDYFQCVHPTLLSTPLICGPYSFETTCHLDAFEDKAPDLRRYRDNKPTQGVEETSEKHTHTLRVGKS